MSLKLALLQLFGVRTDRWATTSGGTACANVVERHESDDFALLNCYAPLLDSTKTRNAFVRREAMLNRAGTVAGYEFSLLSDLQTQVYHEHQMARQAYDSALLTRLALQGVESLLGPRLAFINLSVESLGNSRIKQLPPRNTVLIINLTEHAGDRDELLARLAKLKERGVSVGAMINGASDIDASLMEHMDFGQIDVGSFNGIDLRTLIRDLRAMPRQGRPRILLVARNVQSHDDFQFCNKCGFDLFQGPFIASRESLSQKSCRINRLVLLPILSRVIGDGSFAEIADQLKSEPTMAYKLLRYMNSAAVGLQKPIDNLTDALVFIGREKFYRWTSLLLFDFANPSYQERLLAERALARGRTLELLASKGGIPNDGGNLFLIGLFSLLDEALGRPLLELVEKAVFPEVVRAALLGTPGAYSNALALVTLGDADVLAKPAQMAEALKRCEIDDTVFTAVAAQALGGTNFYRKTAIITPDSG